MSRLTDFYRGAGSDSEGRSLADLWNLSDDEMEDIHDFIQWMFPLREPSRFNPDAPRGFSATHWTQRHLLVIVVSSPEGHSASRSPGQTRRPVTS
jgi:hypothetical protein